MARALTMVLVATATVPEAGAAGKAAGGGILRERSEIPEADRWKLEDLYPTEADWEKDLARLEADLSAFSACKGTLGRSAEDLAGCLDRRFEILKRHARLSSYAERLYDQDARVVAAQKLKDRISRVGTRLDAATAFVEPEILAIPADRLAAYLKSDRLKDYRHYVDNITRRRAHILSPAEEEVVARAGDLAAAPENLYQTLSTLNLPFPEIALKSGEKVTLNQAMYTRFRALPDRTERARVFEAFWGAYRNFRETMAGLLSAVVNRDHFYAQVRKYPGDLEAALDATNVPVDIYRNMIAQVREGLPLLWRYLRLRARLMGISDLGYHDLYAPVVPAAELSYPYAEARAIVTEALRPLGPEYGAVLKEAFTSRWIDVYPNPGKKSGAYMSGEAYDVHPYLLLNYNDDYESVSTLAHELGHAVHSYLSNKHQPYAMADYPIFVAEVASTMNENLLRQHVATRETNRDRKLFLLGQYLENFRQTVFRQALFAEFELRIHEMAAKGEPLTADVLDSLYLRLLREYYGEAEGVMTIAPLYAVEWAYIPHFYYNFYMFQYTTSFVAASALARRIGAGDEKARDRYLAMLRAGGSAYPVDLLRMAGVDMTTSEPYREAFQALREALDEIERLTRNPY